MNKPMDKSFFVTVADVACAAKVSKATVARVLGGYGVISDKVRREVLHAAKLLHYQPNELARSMTTGRSGIIGVVVADIGNPFFSLAVRGITDAARDAGFNVMIANSSESIEAEKAAVRALIGKRVDGLIITPSRSDDTAHLKEIHESGRPLGLLDRALTDIDTDTVSGNDRVAAKRAAEALIAAGHRRLVYMTTAGARGHKFHTVAQLQISSVREQILGFLRACRVAEIPDPESGVHLGANSPEATLAMARALLSRNDRPTGIIASDSQIALEIFRAVRESGMKIPSDLSLVTFRNADWTTVTDPPITVIDQPLYELGRRVSEMVVRRVQGYGLPAERLQLKAAMIHRGSIGPPPPNHI
ncbi:LacI family transcriptional regulator [Rhizobium leguminosarum]|nr:LacI family DNA-binding transcriptional regulator [Rhizobium leguminosarum]MBY5867807.1 LacI family transcriptional regulator [Rhizobium leguminosarum]NKM06444.1 substrate-binding domain-containing protein [Rhizobium leguminosarum bv. viciae]